MSRKVTVEEMLEANEVDATDLEAAIRDLVEEVDTLVVLRVLSAIIVDEMRKLHGVSMKMIIEPNQKPS